MAGWNFAELWEAIADKFPDAQAQVHGDQRYTWKEFDSRADGLAAHLLAGGAVHSDKVALYLYNCPEYMEGCYGAFKAGMVPVNTNYRYLDDELVYLWDNADAVAVVFHGCFTDRVAAVKSKLSKVRQWIWVDDGTDADYAKVNVQYTSNGKPTTIYYVANAGACDPTSGGWYYDVNPTKGEPTKISLCPASCNALKNDAGGRIDVEPRLAALDA